MIEKCKSLIFLNSNRQLFLIIGVVEELHRIVVLVLHYVENMALLGVTKVLLITLLLTVMVLNFS